MKFCLNLAKVPLELSTKLNVKVSNVLLQFNYFLYDNLLISLLIDDQRIYVLKQIDTSRMSAAMRKEAVHEATILSKLNSPYIVKYYDSFTDKNNINIIMEYCENGDLGIHLKR